MIGVSDIVPVVVTDGLAPTCGENVRNTDFILVPERVWTVLLGVVDTEYCLDETTVFVKYEPLGVLDTMDTLEGVYSLVEVALITFVVEGVRVTTFVNVFLELALDDIVEPLCVKEPRVPEEDRV